MRSLIKLALATGIFTGTLYAHNVIYTSLAGTFTQTQAVPPASPYPMSLVRGSADGTIRVAHFAATPTTPEEHCVVMASVPPPMTNSPLISVSPPIGTGLDVTLTVHAERDPVGGSETAFISGEWHATGALDTGGSDPNECNGRGPITALVTVTGVVAPPLITFGNTPFGGSISHPISTSTGELFDEQADLPSFRRYYGSFLSGSGISSALGTNWMHNFDLKLSVSSTTATVTLFRGKTVSFTRSGAAWQLSSNELRPYQLAAAGAGYQFLSPVSNHIYTFDANGVLTRIEDRNGNALTVTQAAGGVGPSQVSDGLGHTLTFTYNGKNLASVRDQSGRSVSYEYANGVLSAWTDANGKRTTFAYTSAGSLGSLLTAQTHPAGNRPFTQQFDSQGRVSSQSDSLSNTASIAYTQTGATVTHPAGVRLTQAHDSQHNLTAQSDPSGASSQYTYDAKGHPTATTDRLGAHSSATWDAASGLPASYTDELGATTTFTYTASTQGAFTFYDLTAVLFADGATISLTRDTKGNVVSLTDPAGRIWRATWSSRGQLATLTNPSGAVTTFSYGQDATLSSVQLDSGDITQIGYDSASRPNLVTHPDNATRAFQYDGLDNPLRVTDERGAVAATSYDDNENLRSVTDALAAVSSLTYDGDDRLASVTDALGAATRRAYDALSRLQSVTNAAGNSITYAYDSQNRPISAVDASGKGFSVGWDREARLTSVTDALSRTVTFTRDARGLVTGVTSANNETYTTAYDALGRVTSTSDPLNHTAQFRYDARGLLVGLSLPAGIAASFARNELGLVTTITDPNGNAWPRTYDKMGRLISSADPLGQSTTYQYDSRQRLSRSVLPQGTAQFIYDAAGNLTGQAYSDGTSLSAAYDADGRLTSADGIALAYDANGRIGSSNGLQITRDPAGRIASITYTSGKTVQYSYNVRGLIATATDWLGGVATFTYDDAGQLISLAFPNGVREDYTYDRNGSPATLSASAGGAVLSSIALHYDAAGQLISADRSAAAIPSPPAGDQENSYDAAHQASSASYDPLGRVTSDPSRNYSWDLASRLLSYDGSDGGASFTYDAFGQRISRTAGGATQTYALNYALGLPSVSIVRNDSGDQRYYVWLPSGVLLYSIEAADNSRHFYHFDESGSTSFLTDDSGAVTDSYAITPYGESVLQTGSTDNPFTFQGRFGVMQEGATGLYYMRARYYDSATARFLSRDPAPALDPRELNPYQYALDNPLRFIDPVGAQGQPAVQQAFTCVANAGTPVIVRVEGITDQVGDILLKCVGGQATKSPLGISLPNLFAIPQITTTAVSGSTPTEALLLIDEPSKPKVEPAWINSPLSPGQQPFNQPSPAPITTKPLASLISGPAGESSLPIPRFVQDPCASRNILNISICRTALLYPFVTSTAGFDTGLAIKNTTTDPFGSSSIGSGTIFTTLPNPTPNFKGYLITPTNFQFAHGFGFVGDGGAQELASDYLPAFNTNIAVDPLYQSSFGPINNPGR